MRILIAEDESRARRGLLGLVEQCGEDCHVVGEAGNGEEALEMLRSLRPDVCITDIRMPVMDGLAMIREARSRGYAVRFIILSAYEEFEVAREAISLGVEEYLVKPVMLEDVRRVLCKIESGSRKEAAQTGDEKKTLADRYENLHPTIRKALRTIECSYAEKISQKELAASLGVTQEYFSTLFSQNIGESFARFLKQYRVGKAKEMLKNGMDIDSTAEACGIGSVKYFSQIFREETGMSPTEYKKKHET